MQVVSDLFDAAVIDDPYPFYERLRGTAPVHRVGDTGFYLVSTAEAVREATARTDDFSSNLTATLVQHGDRAAVFDMDGAGEARHVLATADDPHHALERKLVLPGLVAKRIRALEPEIEHIAERLWEAAASENTIEWMSAMGDRLPMTLVAKLIGLPDADVPQLVDWGYGSTELLGGVVAQDRLPVVVNAAVQLGGYLHTAFDDAMRHPHDDLLGDLARAVDAGDVDREVAVLMLIQLVGAGGESTAGLIGNAARLLATHHDLQAVVRADAALLAPLLEETLRLESPFRAHHRHVTTDTALAGVDLPRGGHLLLMWGSANRDPEAFDDPDLPRLDRANLRGHLAFGKGLHFCVGAALARTEARIALQTLLDHTTWFRLADAEWLPSIFVRRHRRLELAVD
ncbi:cytochrome P450 [Mycobacterium hubeiense]|uniref:cytochrome P450 n=1 Tax=Mycobacterium hubeiense TaxID=1867256 RepID=UPI001E5F235E|nr:cytochrome P450 [Mycobacterium sp. QGD 101]